jgi:hypothetical protein
MKKIKSISFVFAALASFLLSFAVYAVAPTATAKYVYDANNCLTKVVYSNDRTIDFTYDNNGNLTNVAYSGATSAPIVINTQPVYRPVESGAANSITLSLTASGATGYQWQINTNGTWEDILGAILPSLTLGPPLGALNEGLYRCVVTDGTNTIYSNEVMVYVLEPGISDFWTSTTYLAPGSRFAIYNFEVPTIAGDFTAKPKLLKGELVQPVAGKTVTYALTLLTAPTVLSPKETLDCVWPTAVLLYDKKKLTSSYASGFYCADFLGLYPQYDKNTFIVLQTATGSAQYLSRFFTLVPPEITAVKDAVGAVIPPPESASAGDIITINGLYFGKKAPTAWMEYKVSGKPGVSKLLLKVLTPLAYPDEKNVAGKSCMNLDDGVSEIKLLIPTKLPAGIIKGVGLNNLVIDNGQGLATFPFSLQ